jgi:acyl carrier protein
MNESAQEVSEPIEEMNELTKKVHERHRAACPRAPWSGRRAFCSGPAHVFAGGRVLDAERRIKEVMAEVLEIDPGTIGEGFGREGAPAWDSLNHLRMVSALEEAFGIRFTMKEVGELDRFETIRRLVTERLTG